MKAKVIANAKKQKQRKKERHTDFRKTYNKIKTIVLPKGKVNMDEYRNIPKMIDRVSLSAMAITLYPVLCSQSDFEKENWFQLSRENMAILAGISPNSVDKAIQELSEIKLDGTPLLQREMVNSGSRRYYIYQVRFIRKDMMEDWKGQFFPFYTSIINSGIWAELKPRAKMLYLILRQTAKFDFEEYCYIEDLEIFQEAEFNWQEDYRNRKWEMNNLSLAELCKMVGIESSDIQQVLKQLEYYRLVERIGKDFKVYLKPRIRKTIKVN